MRYLIILLLAGCVTVSGSTTVRVRGQEVECQYSVFVDGELIETKTTCQLEVKIQNVVYQCTVKAPYRNYVVDIEKECIVLYSPMKEL